MRCCGELDQVFWFNSLDCDGGGVDLFSAGEAPLGSMLDQTFGIEIIFTWVAAALAAGLIALPLMVRAIEVALANIDPRMAPVARSLGASRWRAF